MRLLCVGRHEFLGEHLCRIFGKAGAQCESVVGLAEALRRAADFEPHLIVAEVELLSEALLDRLALRGVPVLAVSLTRRPEECMPAEQCGVAGVVYLPTLDEATTRAILEAMSRPRGLEAPGGLPARQPLSLLSAR